MNPEAASAETTLVVILGASDYHKSGLESSSAFLASARDFTRYLREEDGFGIPKDNILDLFDSEARNADILEMLDAFLRRSQEKTADPPRDLIVYYTGHGGFTSARDYFLAIRSTARGLEGGSSLRMTDLAATIKASARRLRRFLILDCCFSAAAFSEFQSAPLTAARVATIDSFPREGTTLLCSSNARSVSIAPVNAQYTMFSGALLQVLRRGVPSIESPLSLEQVGAYVHEYIRAEYPSEAVRPEVLSPDIRVEDIAHMPFFPNAATRPRQIRARVEALSAKFESLAGDLTAFRLDLRHALAALSGEVAKLAEERTAGDARLKDLHQAVSALDDKVSGAISETANRLTELKSANEGLAGRVRAVEKKQAAVAAESAPAAPSASPRVDPGAIEHPSDIGKLLYCWGPIAIALWVALCAFEVNYTPDAFAIGASAISGDQYSNPAHTAQWGFSTLLHSVFPALLVSFVIFGILAAALKTFARRWRTATVMALLLPSSYAIGLAVASEVGRIGAPLSDVNLSVSSAFNAWVLMGMLSALAGGLACAFSLGVALLLCGARNRGAYLLLLVMMPAWLLGWVFNLISRYEGRLTLFGFVAALVMALVLARVVPFKWATAGSGPAADEAPRK